MPCRPSAPIFGQRSRGNWLLLVDFGGARRDLVGSRKSCTVSRMASAVSPRSKLNIRCALGIMVGRPPAKSCGLLGQALAPANAACHGKMIRLRIGRDRCSSMRPKHQTRPCPRHARRGVIRLKTLPRRANHGARKPITGEAACTEPSNSPIEDSPAQAARERAYSMPLADFDPGDPELFRTDTFWPYFDRLRKEDPVHYCKDSMFGPYWSVTKYNDIMEIETNHAVFSSAASLGGITIRDVAARPAPRKLHRHGPAAPPRAAQDRGADVHADPSRPARDQHPQALGRMPRQSAAQRDVRLGRQGLDRTDHADAGGAVRLPLGGPPQADALVRRRDHASRARTASSRPKTSGRPNCWNARPISRSCGTSASTSRRRATCCR